MTRFVREHGYPKSEHNVVRKGIQRGITQLLFKMALERVSKTPAQKRAVQGILARVTIFEHALFQSISIFDLLTLAKALLEGHDGDATLISECELSKWFVNMTGDFDMISRTTKRGRRDPPRTAHAPSHVAHESVALNARREDCPSDNSETSNSQTDATVYPSINSHELATFSTVSRIALNSPRMPLHAPFIEFQDTPEEVGLLQNTVSHDLAEFSRNTNDAANCALARNSNSCSEPHELSLFSRVPSSMSAQTTFSCPTDGFFISQ